MRDSRMYRRLVPCLVLFLMSTTVAKQPAPVPWLEHVECSKGVCSIVGGDDGRLAIALAKQTSLLIHEIDADRSRIDAATQFVADAGLLGTRIQCECVAGNPLPYANRLVDLIVIQERGAVIPREIVRVVRPNGTIVVRTSTRLTGPLHDLDCDIVETLDEWTILRRPDERGEDDWPHWSHGPDNNPVSADSVIRAPYLSQWLARPYYVSMPVVSTAAGGRVFVACGHIAHHDREIPTLNTLIARNGYNGQVLWQRKLPEGYLVHRSAFIATDDVFFMIDGDSIRLLDTETGKDRDRIAFPSSTGQPVWIAKVDDVLYVLMSADEPPTQTMKVHADWRGWGWSNVDKNYSPNKQHQIRWGFGETILAYDLKTRRTLWKHGDSNIDSRGMGILKDQLFYYVPSTRLVCLNRRTGSLLWQNPDEEHLKLIEQEAQGLAGTPGFRTTSMLLATPVGLFIQGQKRANVVAFDRKTGQFRWSKKKYHNNPNMLYVNNRLYISGLGKSGSVQQIDPQTGDTLEELNFWKGSCARMTSSPDALFCRGEGLGRFDFDLKRYQAERSGRPGCNDGAIPANGLLYVGPWLCDCNLAILGQMVLGPADGFKPHEQTLSRKHLELGDGKPSEPASAVDALDWPTYRSNNQRTNASAATVPDKAHVLFSVLENKTVLQTPPVAVAQSVLTAGDDGCIQCLDSRSGAVKWTHSTGGPIIASATVWNGRVFVGSGDGSVYCLDAANGRLLWRFRIAPIERRIMLYGHLASTWPVNSGVLIHDGIAYAAAGLMFRDGTHVVALDAETGELIWHNGETGRPINDRFELRAASVAGGLAIGRGRLWLASGNVVAPVSFNLKTGEANVVPATRVPQWNTVMAQKPEPSGKELLVFDDQFILHGGRLLYSGEGRVVSAAQVNLRLMDAQGRLQGPAFTPVRHCAIPPAWDADVFVSPTSRYGRVVAWNHSDVVQHLRDALTLMVDMDKKIPGTSPEKWGQYNLIGKAFGAVERNLQSTSLWPASRNDVYAIAVAKNAVVMTERVPNAKSPNVMTAYSKRAGNVMWQVPLPGEPRLGSIAINRDGSILVTVTDGSVLCIGDIARALKSN